jgi:hypothetical protein
MNIPKQNIEILIFFDLKNNIHHVFGHHSKCSDGTCNTVGDQTESQIPDLKNNRIYDHLCGMNYENV